MKMLKVFAEPIAGPYTHLKNVLNGNEGVVFAPPRHGAYGFLTCAAAPQGHKLPIQQ
jgi:hypothetical protein